MNEHECDYCGKIFPFEEIGYMGGMDPTDKYCGPDANLVTYCEKCCEVLGMPNMHE